MNPVKRSAVWAGLQWYKFLESLHVGKFHWTRPKEGEWGYIKPLEDKK